MNGEMAFGWKGKVLSHHNNIENTETILCHSNASINDQPQWFCTNQFNPQERPKQHPFVMMVISVTMFCQLVLSLDLMLFNVDVPGPVLCADKLTPLHLVQITFHSFIQHHTSQLWNWHDSVAGRRSVCPSVSHSPRRHEGPAAPLHHHLHPAKPGVEYGLMKNKCSGCVFFRKPSSVIVGAEAVKRF